MSTSGRMRDRAISRDSKFTKNPGNAGAIGGNWGMPSHGRVIAAFVVATFWHVGAWAQSQEPRQPEPSAEAAIFELAKTLASDIQKAGITERAGGDAPRAVEGAQTLPPKGTRDPDFVDVQRQVAEYTRQLSIYTNEVGNFTKWLIIVTAILVAVGALVIWQTERTVETFIGGERPHIFLGDPEPHLLHAGTPYAINPWVEFVLINYGRTPAMVSTLRAELYLGPELPRTRQFNNAVRFNGPSVLHREPDLYKIEFPRVLTEKEVAELNDERLHFYLFGYLKYRDVFDMHHERGFGYRFDKQEAGFRTVGGNAYNYYFRTKPGKNGGLLEPSHKSAYS
jgi:hypothetical protein